MKIYIDRVEYIPEEKTEKATAVEMWYDRHRREWVIYPIDSEGNQLSEASYGFSKKEALNIKASLEAELL